MSFRPNIRNRLRSFRTWKNLHHRTFPSSPSLFHSHLKPERWFDVYRLRSTRVQGPTSIHCFINVSRSKWKSHAAVNVKLIPSGHTNTRGFFSRNTNIKIVNIQEHLKG